MYLQIIEQIKLRIAVGDWSAGFKLPSIRELAIGLRVSVITVKRAYMELERENVIVTQQGKGSFIAEHDALGSQLQYEELDKQLEKAVKLGTLLGLDEQALQDRLETVYQQMKKESS